MRGIVIVGAGGHGRGILEILIAAAHERGDGPAVQGFLDDDSTRSGSEVGGVPILGTTALLPQLAREHDFVIGLGDPDPRRMLAERIVECGGEFRTAVHPSSVLYGNVTASPGVVVGAGAVVAAETWLGPHVLINLGATVGHDCRLEAYATVAPGVNIGGFVTMEEGSFAGLGAVITPGLRLGAGSKLGPGSVLLENLGADRIAFGVPARVIDRRNRS